MQLMYAAGKHVTVYACAGNYDCMYAPHSKQLASILTLEVVSGRSAYLVVYLLWGRLRSLRLFERDIDLLPVWTAIKCALWVSLFGSLKVSCSHSGDVQAVHALQEVLDLELQQVAPSVLPVKSRC